jgi:hypothetical protein
MTNPSLSGRGSALRRSPPATPGLRRPRQDRVRED